MKKLVLISTLIISFAIAAPCESGILKPSYLKQIRSFLDNLERGKTDFPDSLFSLKNDSLSQSHILDKYKRIVEKKGKLIKAEVVGDFTIENPKSKGAFVYCKFEKTEGPMMILVTWENESWKIYSFEAVKKPKDDNK